MNFLEPSKSILPGAVCMCGIYRSEGWLLPFFMYWRGFQSCSFTLPELSNSRSSLSKLVSLPTPPMAMTNSPLFTSWSPYLPVGSGLPEKKEFIAVWSINWSNVVETYQLSIFLVWQVFQLTPGRHCHSNLRQPQWSMKLQWWHNHAILLQSWDRVPRSFPLSKDEGNTFVGVHQIHCWNHQSPWLWNSGP